MTAQFLPPDRCSSGALAYHGAMKLIVERGDITKFTGDAIVNAANTSLLGGGGVDGAIHRAAGPDLLAECQVVRNRQGGCQVGAAVITGSGRLPARFVIHTVGPTWIDGEHNEPQLLAYAYRSSLTIAAENNLQSLAFPNISTGVYRFPKEQAAKIAITTVREFALAESHVIKAVTFMCFDDKNYQIYCELLGAVGD